MDDPVPDRISDRLPGWIIERAAAYMLHRYGRAARMRAAARHRALLDLGDHRTAAHWLRVTAAIERLGAAPTRPARRRLSTKPEPFPPRA